MRHAPIRICCGPAGAAANRRRTADSYSSESGKLSSSETPGRAWREVPDRPLWNRAPTWRGISSHCQIRSAPRWQFVDQAVYAYAPRLREVPQSLVLTFRNSNRQRTHFNSFLNCSGSTILIDVNPSSDPRKSRTLFVTIMAAAPVRSRGCPPRREDWGAKDSKRESSRKRSGKLRRTECARQLRAATSETWCPCPIRPRIHGKGPPRLSVECALRNRPARHYDCVRRRLEALPPKQSDRFSLSPFQYALP